MSTVFQPKVLDQFASALRQLANTFYDRTPLHLTGDEFIAAFIHPDHIGKLREVQELVGFVGSSSLHTIVSDSQGQPFDMAVAFTGNAPVILPQYTGKGIQPTCPDDVKSKITVWVDERRRFGDAFGDAHDALYALNSRCGDAAAMSLTLPCLPTIMGRVSDDGANKTVQRARKLTDVKSFGKLPKLPAHTKQRLVEISAIVNSTTLMLDAQPPETVRHDALCKATIKNNPRLSIFWGHNAAFI